MGKRLYPSGERMKTVKCDDASHQKVALLAAKHSTSMAYEVETAIKLYFNYCKNIKPEDEEIAI